MILDRFLAGVPEDLRMWLKEMKPVRLSKPLNWQMTMPWLETLEGLVVTRPMSYSDQRANEALLPQLSV